MVISHNRTSFPLWLKEKLVKHQKVSKYYENDCPKKFVSLFMPLLTPRIFKNSRVYARIFFFFLKKRPKANLKVFWKQLSTSVKISEKHL